jgi:hypothetical protein
LDKILQRVFIPYGSLEGIPIIFNENIITELILQPINSGHIMSTGSITKSLLDRRMPLTKLTRLTDLHIISDRALNRAPLNKKHEWQQLESLLPPNTLIHCRISSTGLPRKLFHTDFNKLTFIIILRIIGMSNRYIISFFDL